MASTHQTTIKLRGTTFDLTDPYYRPNGAEDGDDNVKGLTPREKEMHRLFDEWVAVQHWNTCRTCKPIHSAAKTNNEVYWQNCSGDTRLVDRTVAAHFANKVPFTAEFYPEQFAGDLQARIDRAKAQPVLTVKQIWLRDRGMPYFIDYSKPRRKGYR